MIGYITHVSKTNPTKETHMTTTTLNFKPEGFGIHSATIGEYLYNIAPIAYDRKGNPKHGYTAVRIASRTSQIKPTFAEIARGTFAECREACKTDAQNI
jgi:hypothetical protein